MVIVLFEVTIKEGKKEDYLKRTADLKNYACDVKGFIRAERFVSTTDENKLLSMTVWENEESIAEWRNFSKHRESQGVGRNEDFADYTITVVTPVRSYSLNERTEAPHDSNNYFNVG